MCSWIYYVRRQRTMLKLIFLHKCCLICSSTLHPHKHITENLQQHPKIHHTTQSKHHRHIHTTININGITNKRSLDNSHTQPDIITIQETKLTTTSHTPKITNYTPIRTDRVVKLRGGLLTYIRHNITFTHLDVPKNITILTDVM